MHDNSPTMTTSQLPTQPTDRPMHAFQAHKPAVLAMLIKEPIRTHLKLQTDLQPFAIKYLRATIRLKSGTPSS